MFNDITKSKAGVELCATLLITYGNNSYIN